MAKNLILSIAGFLLLGLGIIGIAVPVMPTTPFVLGAAVCLSGHKKVRPWLMKNRYFGSYIENYTRRRGVPRDVKIKSILFLWAGLTVSFVLVANPTVRIILPIVGAAVTTHILMLRTRKEAPAGEDPVAADTMERES